MEARLNIYADCTSEKPTKTYVCRRLLLKVSKKVASLVEGMNDKTEAEQEAITVDVPEFKDEEFEGIDPIEWLDFIKEISKETNDILTVAQKN